MRSYIFRVLLLAGSMGIMGCDSQISNFVSGVMPSSLRQPSSVFSVTLSSTTSSVTNVSPIPVNLVFSGSVTGLTLSGITVTGGTASALTGSGTTYAFSVTPSGQGVIDVSVNAGAATEAGGNLTPVSNTLVRTYDTVSPSVVLSSTVSGSTNLSSVPVTVTFSTSVTGFTAAQLTLVNATVSGFSGSGAVYTFNLLPSAQGVFSASLAAGVAQDAATNLNLASNTLSLTYNTTQPTATLASTTNSSTNVSPIPVTLTFSSSVTGFSLSGLSITNGTASGLAGSGANYSFNVTPSGQGLVSVTVNAGAGTDGSGNLSLASAALTRTYDSIAPTVTLASTANSSTNVSPIPVTVTFSESVTGFSLAGLSITNGTASGLAGSGASYSFNVTPSGQGLVSITVNAGAASDAASNLSVASSALTRTYDTVAPTAVLASTTTSATNVSPIPVTLTFSESVTGFSLAGLTISNGTASGLAGSGASYSFNVTPSAQGVVSVTVNAGAASDAAGNLSVASIALTRTYNTTHPTTILTTTTSSPTNTASFPVTVTFSASVTGFSLSSVTVTNGTAAILTGIGTTYTFNVTPTAQGSVSVTVNAGAATDSAGNLSLVSNTLPMVYDTTKPTVVLATTTTSPTNQSSVPVTVTFSKSVTGLAVPAGLTLVNATVTGFAGSGASYTFNLIPSGQGTFSVQVNAGAAQDAATNTSVVSNNLSLVYDSVAPALTFTSAGVQTQYTNTNTATFTGSCETGLSVVVSGTDTSSTACVGSAWSYTTAAQSTNTNRSYTFTQTDAATNTTSITGTWSRNTVGPVVTNTSPATNFPAQTGVTMGGACENGVTVVFAGSGALGTVNGTCSSGAYSQFVYFSATDGSKAITVTQTDQWGNVGTATGNFIKDTTPPAITQTTHASPYYNNLNSATFGGACETGLTVVVTGTDSTTTSCAAGTWSYTTSTKTSDGSYPYTFTQTDAAGNVGSIGATWNRLTSPPLFNFTTASSFLTSGNSVTFGGNCVSGLGIAVTGSATSSFTCAGGTWSYSPTNTVDGAYSYTITETDQAGNTSVLSGTWTRSTSGPTLTITQASPTITSGSSLVISGTCNGGTAGSNGVINITGAVTTTTSCSSNNATMGTWSYTANQAVDGVYNYTFSTTDNFSTPRTTSASIAWWRDTTAPIIGAGSFSINGGTNTTTAVSYNPVNFSATDNVSYVTSFCLKTTNSAPLVSDSCWYPVNGSATNVTPSNSLAISNYSYNVGIIPQTYSVYLWIMDGAGNVSTNTSTSGKDVVNITYSPISPPTVNTVLVGNSDTMNGASSERTIPGGSNVYVRWTASGTSLGSTPVSLYFTSDDQNWTLISSGLANGNNGCSSVTGTGSASTTSTGCYLWSSGSPTSSYYRVRVSLTNTVNASTFANSLPINAAQMQILAGNTEQGIGGSAASGFLVPDLGLPAQADHGAFVVNSSGTIYFRDLNQGILYINPVDGVLRRLIPLGATTSGYGDGGSVYNAKLRNVTAIAIDYQDRLLIFDYNRIRRIDFSQNPPIISTIIGGGASTANTITGPLNIQLSSTVVPAAIYRSVPLFVLPNGDIYFYSETYSYTNGGMPTRIRHYSVSTNTITSIVPSGTATAGAYTFNAGTCGNGDVAIAYDKTSSQINFMGTKTYQSGYTACTTPSSLYHMLGMYQIDPVSGNLLSIPTQFNGTNFYSEDFNNGYAATVQAMDGNIYTIDRNLGLMKEYNVSSNTWTTIAGTGTIGSCADGTTATGCTMDTAGAFVDINSNIYILDRNQIRVISAGKMSTLVGQSSSYGDGGLATNARFGTLWGVQQQNDSQYVTLDQGSNKFRLFPAQGNISTIAGNGASGIPNTTSQATAQPLNSSGSFNYFTAFGIDPSTNDIFYAFSGSKIGRLVRSTGIWSVIGGGGGTLYISMTDGATASSINLGNLGHVRGFNGSQLLFAVSYYNGTNNVNYSLIQEDTSAYTLNFVMGNVAQPIGSGYCAAGTAAMSCATMPAPGTQSSSNVSGSTMSSYDSTTSQWLLINNDQKTIMALAPEGTFATWTTLNNTAKSFLAVRVGGNPYIYYCAWSNGQIYLRNVNTATEVALPWAIPSLSCAPYNMIYNATTEALVFPFTQNGLYGVGQLLQADPADNGL